MKKILFSILLLIILLSFNNISFAVTQQTVSNIQDLATFFVDEEDDGIEIDVSSFKLYKGNINQLGIFKDATSETNLGFDHINDGIILTAGNVTTNMFCGYTDHPYPNYVWNSDGWSPGNPIQWKTFDPIYISFDVKSHTDTVSFQYIFASEEFDQSPIYDDKMFFRYKKKGEPDSSYTNIAINPNYDKTGGNLGLDVSINNLRNTSYHYDNLNGASSDVFSFLGYTPLLSCKANVQPEQEYTFLIGLLDVGDPIFDSALLLKAHSLSSKEPPPSEKNPNPSSRRVFSPKKEISALQVTLSNGTILHSAIVTKDKFGNPKLNSSSKGVILAGDKDSYDLYVTMDEELMHGAELQVEYRIDVENSSAGSFAGYIIADQIDEKFYYDPDQRLLSDPTTNAAIGWKLEPDNILKLDRTEFIKSSNTVSRKVIFSRILTDSSENYEPFINSGVMLCKHSSLSGLHSDNTPPESFESGKVIIIPPTGDEDYRTQYIIWVLLSLIFISIIIYIIYKRKKHKTKKITSRKK